jgi:hypothetical protein
LPARLDEPEPGVDASGDLGEDGSRISVLQFSRLLADVACMSANGGDRLQSGNTAVGKETGETAHSERWNTTLRQRLARVVRMTWSFSKSVVMLRPRVCSSCSIALIKSGPSCLREPLPTSNSHGSLRTHYFSGLRILPLPQTIVQSRLLRFLASHMTHLSYLLFRLPVLTSRKPLDVIY